jgi:hypothetical protein
MLFGAPNQNRYRRYDRYSGREDYYYSPAPSSYGSNGYRTLCVRMCDGYYWPISFSTSRYGLTRDAQRCESSCGAPARLFYYRNPGGCVEGMVDLQGNPYANLEKRSAIAPNMSANAAASRSRGARQRSRSMNGARRLPNRKAPTKPPR